MYFLIMALIASSTHLHSITQISAAQFDIWSSWIQREPRLTGHVPEKSWYMTSQVQILSQSSPFSDHIFNVLNQI